MFDKFGAPSRVARCVEVADPTAPSAWEIMVSVEAFPINPADLAMIQGQYGVLNTPPATIGMEAVGTVVECGRSVQSVVPGDRVILLANNNWATLRKVPATLAVKVSRDIDVLQLSMLKVSAMTAHLLLTHFEQLTNNQYFIQNAPLSSVGRYALGIAKILGLKSVNLVRREEQVPLVRELGGDIVLLEHADVASEVRERIGVGGVRLAIDAVAGESSGRLAAMLQEGGLLVNYGMLSMQPCQIDASQLIFRNIRMIGFWLSKVLNKLSAHDRQQRLLQLVQWLEEGKIECPIDSVYSMDDIGAAIQRAEQTARAGKVIVCTDSSVNPLTTSKVCNHEGN